MVERVVVVSPRGFCAGVVRAISIVERTLAAYGPPVYVRRAIVHNRRVVDRLAAAGAIVVDELEAVPEGSVVVLSAHGVSAAVRVQADARHLRVVDAICPLVAKVHREVRRFHERGLDVVVIGTGGDDEVVGTMGQAPGMHLVESVGDVADLRVADPRLVGCVTQTTLSGADLAPLVAMRARFPTLVEPPAGDICYATRNRQAAVAWLAGTVDLVLVVGDCMSSNSRRLTEVAGATGTPAYLIGSVQDLEQHWLTEAPVVGVSAGASTPEDLVAEVVGRLCGDGATLEAAVLLEERVTFGLPPALAEQPLP